MGNWKPTNTAFSCGSCLDQVSYMIWVSTVCSAGLDSGQLPLTLQGLEGASSPFLLKNDMTGPTLWTFPQLTDTIPWTCRCLHSNGSVPDTPVAKTGYYRSPGNCCQIQIFFKSKPRSEAILSINVLLPGWCGNSIVGNDVTHHGQWRAVFLYGRF